MCWTKAILLLASLAPAAAAEERLNLDELIREAIRSNPELQAAQKRVEAARQRPRQEGALPDPMVSVGYSSSGVPLPGFGIGREPVANTGFMVTQELPYPGKRRLRSGAAAKEADAERQLFLLKERAIIARLKAAFHRLIRAYEVIDVIRRSQDLFTRFINLAHVRYSAGKAMQQDIFKAQTQLALTETRIARMRQDVALATAEINSLLHRRPDAPLAQPFHEAPRPLVFTLDQLVANAEASFPAIVREQNMAEARQFEVSLARKNSQPDFAVSAGYYYMGALPDMYQFRLDIRLPAWRGKREAALAEKVHALGQARRGYEAVAQEARWRVNELYLTAQTAWRLMRMYRDSVIPQAELSVQSALASYEAGLGESLSVVTNMIASVEQEERYHEEMLSYFIALIGLEEVTGLEVAQ